MSLGRLELPLLASEASALSTELQGHLVHFTMHVNEDSFESFLLGRIASNVLNSFIQRFQTMVHLAINFIE